ncbi:MAG: L-2-hydroxyglutarate oxidase [Chloroflexi bacterium]|nr:L-2-hydroxyglutarate oxidase [Chloroflexota bacterium]
MTAQPYDVTIVGGGILGLATARELLGRHPSLRLVVLEKEERLGQHQTGHNSGVIHSGIYYAPGSLKAKLCVDGGQRLKAYCDERGIPYERRGKVIVATEESELPRLEELHRRGTSNGVQGLEMVGPERLREIEPFAAGIRALYSPNTSIVDYARVAAAYADDVRERGGEILTAHEVKAVTRQDGEILLETTGGAVRGRHIVSCAGLQADRVAELTGSSPDPAIVPFRGDYYTLKPQARSLVRGLIYPVPDPAFPFLGVHFTKRINGEIWAGPNAVLAFAREGYRRLDVVPADLLETLRHPGFQQVAKQYWKIGLGEMYRDVWKAVFVRDLQRYVPIVAGDHLTFGPSGVRAQAISADGKLVDDFIVDHAERVIHIRNAPSPAATSSLALASLICDRADESFELSA